MTTQVSGYSGAVTKFRTDIEGLRAFAVAPVLLFHANIFRIFNIPVAPGGFVGVDVFFVISGYLVSGYIYKSLIHNNNYSIVEFYGRRIKRLFPAIFVIYLFCLAISAAIMLPSEMVDTQKSVLSSILFSSNLYFAAKAGYFGGALNSSPLLHTWSLSVEEQFYVVFPLVLLALRPLSQRWRVLVLAALALLSLAYSQYLVFNNMDRAYYSLLARFWELLLGSLLAVTTIKPLPKPAMEAMAALGLLAILYSVTQYQVWTLFPGLSALPPCLGAAVLLYTGRHHATYTGRFMALAPFRFIGKISYSLYLWHWPLIVYCRLLVGGGHAQMLVTLGLSVVAAWLSWRFVEQPIRNLSRDTGSVKIVQGGLVAAVLTAALSFGAVALNDRVYPPTPQTEALQAFQDNYKPDSDMRSGECFLTSHTSDMASFPRSVCMNYRPGAFNVLLLGDSHSAQYYRALRAALPDANIMQASSTGCLPLIGTVGTPGCTALWRYVTQSFLPAHHVDAIVVGGFWQPPDAGKVFPTAEWLTQFADRVYIIGPNPRYQEKLPRLLIMAHYKGDAYVTRYIPPDDRAIDAELSAISLPARVVYLSYYHAMCQGACPLLASDGHPTTFDDNHLTTAASEDVFSAWQKLGLIGAPPR